MRVSRTIKKYRYLTWHTVKTTALYTYLLIKGVIFNTLAILCPTCVRQLLFSLNKKAYVHFRHLFFPILAFFIARDTNGAFVLEIGTGHATLAKYLSTQPKDFAKMYGLNLPLYTVTVEKSKKFYKKFHKKLQKLANVLHINADGYQVLRLFGPKSLDMIIILFPDPWHKARHHKRRPLTTEFFKQAYWRLKPGGKILIATDHKEYFTFILNNLLEFSDKFKITQGRFEPKNLRIPPTHYYKKWARVKKQSYYILAEKSQK